MNWLRSLFRPRTDCRPDRIRRQHLPVLERLEDRVTPSRLIPVTGARDLVFDGARDLLYITTSAGRVERYDLASNTLLTPWNVGTVLNGADITPAGDYLYAADRRAPVLRKVDLTTGQVTNVSYTGADSSWDVKVAANGLVFFDSQYTGSLYLDLYALDPATGTITSRRHIQPYTGIVRGVDRSRLFFQEDNSSLGPMFTYDSATDSFPSSLYAGSFLGNVPAAVSPDGSRIAIQFAGVVSVLDPSLQPIDILGTGDGGLVFDPVRDFLYAIDPGTAQVVAYDTDTWRERFRVDVGATIDSGGLLGDGATAVSGDGRELFLITPAGVREIDLSAETGVARSLAVSGFASFTGQGSPGSFTVTVRDALGNVVPDYQGTVQFSSSDPAAILPPSYTFTAGDQGTHTFSATFGTAGTFSLTARDSSDPTVSGSESGIRIHNHQVSLIPVTNARETVYDPSRDILYISTSGGKVERYQVGSQTLLPPFEVGHLPNGLDITPDCQTLYVSDRQPVFSLSRLWKVDLTTEQVTEIRYPDGYGSWDVKAVANGLVLFDSYSRGAGHYNLYALDPATGTFTSRLRISENASIARGADRSRLFFQGNNSSDGPIFTYDSATDSFPSSASTQGTMGNVPAAVSRDGSRIAVRFGGLLSILDPGLLTVEILGVGGDGGLAFDPVRDLLYALDVATAKVVAYDTTTWHERFRLDVGTAIGYGELLGNGALTVSSDGSKMFLITSTGVRLIDLTTGVGVARSLQVSGFPSFTGQGSPGSFTVTVRDALGNVVPDYQGIVQFSSSDPAAILPPSYTFTAGDQGTHTFTAAFQTAGTFTLTAQDVSDPTISGSESGIRIHDNHQVSLIPVTNARETVYDPSRDILYISTSGGKVERYQVDTQTLLAPFDIGLSLNGLDISSDDNTLYVGEGRAGASGSLLREVDLTTGQLTNISSPNGAGTWDVKVAANGLVLFDFGPYSSRGITLDFFDPATGIVTSRRSVTPHTGIARGADRSRMFFPESDLSSGPIFTYDSATDSFPSSGGTDTYLDNKAASVSRDGSWIALQFDGAVSVLDPDLQTLQILRGGNGGLSFDPVRDLLYALDVGTAKVVAYDTNTWHERFRLDVGAAIGSGGLLGNGAVTVSSDGSELFLITSAGVREVDLPTETGVARNLEVKGFPSFTGQGTEGTFTLTVRDALGNVVPDY